MEQLIKSVENVTPGKYDLHASDLTAIYKAMHNDIFGLISFVFKLGFARGQKAVKQA